MSRRTRKRAPAHAAIFAALGDETRLSLVSRLADAQRHSISQLTEGTGLTRQAITKHLRILEAVRIVRHAQSGRENLFEFDPEPIRDVKEYLDLASAHWDDALGRLKAFVEN